MASSSSSSSEFSTSTHGIRRNVDRRWSVDVGSTLREGYVRDLRRIPSKDESYPFMLTETQKKEANKSNVFDNGSSVKSGSSVAVSGGGTETLASPTSSSSSGSPLFKPVSGGAGGRRYLMPRASSIGTSAMMFGNPPSSSNSVGARNKRKGSYCGRIHSSSMDVSTIVVPEDFEMTQSSYSISGNQSNNSGQNTNTTGGRGPVTPLYPPHLLVEERPVSALSAIRQRSSSLPRILPPIFDGDGVEERLDQIPGVPTIGRPRRSLVAGMIGESSSSGGFHDIKLSQGKSAIAKLVREMQKFVCRQTGDVSHLLPLPLPSKLSLIRDVESPPPVNSVPLSPTGASNNNTNNNGLPTNDCYDSHQCYNIIMNLAKVHAVSISMSKLNGLVLSETLAALNLAHQCDPQSRKNKIVETTASQFPDLEEPVKYLLLDGRNSREIYFLPPVLCLHEDIHPRAIQIRYIDGRISQVKFTNVSKTYMGYFLIDIYSFIFNCLTNSNDGESGGLSFTLDELQENVFKVYFENMIKFLTDLRVDVINTSLNFDEFLKEIWKYWKSGMTLVYIMNFLNLEEDTNIPLQQDLPSNSCFQKNGKFLRKKLEKLLQIEADDASH